MKGRLRLWLGIGITVGVLGGLVYTASPNLSILGTQRSGQGFTTVVNTSYAGFTQDQMLAEADLIIVGQIEDISPSAFNSDDGQYYESTDADLPLPIHNLTVAVQEVLAGTTDADVVTVTVIGNSPVGPASTTAEGSQIAIGGEAPHGLQIGDQGMFFLRNTELAWRGGTTKPVVMFLGDPSVSYLKRGDDGQYHGGPDNVTISLEQLASEIASQRSGSQP